MKYCADCAAELLPPGHVCARCGRPQPVAAGADYFAALGVPRRFRQDLAQLEKRYYEASRILHPDRFTASGPDAPIAKMRSLERMSWVNQAYQTLKQPESIRQYLLEVEGIPAPQSKIPAELAEGWFEIRDLMMDEPEVAVALLGEFEGNLARVKAEREEQLRSLENQADEAAGSGSSSCSGDVEAVELRRALLERIARLAQEKNYIASMERDIERIKKQFS